MVRRERFVNNTTTTVVGTLTAGATSVPVADGSAFPSEGDFRVKIDSEILLVTARSGNTLTATRGAEGTTAASHSSGATVAPLLTAGSLQQLVEDAAPQAFQRPPFRLSDENDDIITTLDFSWRNQGSAGIANDASGGLTMTITPTSGGLRILELTKPGGTINLTARVVFGPGAFFGASGSEIGLAAINNSTGDLLFGGIRCGDEGFIAEWDGPTDGTPTDVTTSVVKWQTNEAWIKMQVAGSTVTFWLSTDGNTFFQIGQELISTHVSTVDRIGWCVNSIGRTGKKAHLQSFTF